LLRRREVMLRSKLMKFVLFDIVFYNISFLLSFNLLFTKINIHQTNLKSISSIGISLAAKNSGLLH
jgi:hypothetical protein